jgi:putative toxin-antitoxin system antitoxin component (TIGR02293 family)
MEKSNKTVKKIGKKGHVNAPEKTLVKEKMPAYSVPGKGYLTVSHGNLGNTVTNRLKQYSGSKKLFSNLIIVTGLPINFLAEMVFEVTPKTLSKYKNENVRIPAVISELAVKLEIMYELGLEIFGSKKDFNRWLGEKSFGLNNKKPAEFLNTSTGIELVYDELNRIAFGATA